ncbi:MAG: LamG-like jellyroll fold domain-containing protein, partial [Planctomycetota bacterium]
MLSDHALAAMDRKNKKGKWRTAGKYSLTMILAGDTIFAGGIDEVAAFRTSDGEQIWTDSVEGGAYGLAVADGALFVSTDQGRIACFMPGKGKAKSPATRGPGKKDELEVLDVPAFKSRGLVGRWLLQSGAVKGRKVYDLAGKHHAEAQGSPRLVKLGKDHQGMNFEGQVSSLRIADDHKDAGLPAKAVSAEAWVRVDQAAPWGCIIGAFQDNGSYEKGWLLGYVGSRFSLAVQGTGGAGAMTYMKASSDFRTGQWYHVAGTYDGVEMKLYINGKLSASGKTQSGPIDYPPTAFYEMAAYHDKDEYFRMKGALNEVRVYDRVLSAAECIANSRSKKLVGGAGAGAPPAGESLALAAGPFLHFTALDKALVQWETAEPSKTAALFGPRDGELKKIGRAGLRKVHELEFTGLVRNRLYTYRILADVRGKELSTPDYECDNFFNLVLPPVRAEANPYSQDAGRSLAGGVAERVLRETGIDRGICLVLGSGDGQLAWEIAARSRLQVVGVDTSAKAIEEARKLAYKAGVYGARLKYYKVESLSKLPFTGHFANLVVSAGMLSKGRCEGSAAEVFRVLRPDGGVACLGQPAGIKPSLSKTALASWLKRGKVKFEAIDRDGTWAMVRRGKLKGAGSWTHQYGRADNSAFGGEELSGAGGTSDLDVQWIGRPGPRAQPDRNGRKPSPLSTNGRLFVQGLHRIICLDSYNGSILWSWEIPSMMRFNMPRDCSNWCADGDSVFVAMGGRCWRIDAKTGALSRSYKVRPGNIREWEYDWSYLAREGDKVIGSGVKKGTAFTSFWGGSGAGWYDAKSGPVTHKVCSENLFALYEKSGQLKWEYSKGVIVNPTITISGGRVYFVENRNSGVKKAADRRVGSRALWTDQYLVALDSDSGNKIWEKPIDTADGDVVFYLASGAG